MLSSPASSARANGSCRRDRGERTRSPTASLPSQQSAARPSIGRRSDQGGESLQGAARETAEPLRGRRKARLMTDVTTAAERPPAPDYHPSWLPPLHRAVRPRCAVYRRSLRKSQSTAMMSALRAYGAFSTSQARRVAGSLPPLPGRGVRLWTTLNHRPERANTRRRANACSLCRNSGDKSGISVRWCARRLR
jgi:hypothetical protein